MDKIGLKILYFSTTVKPINRSLTPKASAISTAFTRTTFPPINKPARPIISKKNILLLYGDENVRMMK